MHTDSTVVSDASLTSSGATHADIGAWIQRGFRVLPVGLREKGCKVKGWPNLWITEEQIPQYFGSPSNVGVLTGPGANDLGDVDVDCSEALALADTIMKAMPSTLVFGRASKRRSHYFFKAKGLKTEKFADPTSNKGGMIIEIRSEGCQTVAPGSVHESGEVVAFEGSYVEPAEVEAGELRRHIALIAFGALIARHWPKKGNRHNASLALCGVLLRAGWREDDVEVFVSLIAEAAGDEEHQARGRNARSSASRLAASEPTSGWPSLANLMGPVVVDKAHDWLGIWTPTRHALPAPPSLPAPSIDASRLAVDQRVFRGVAGDIVKAIEPHSEADPLAILVQLLVAFGSVIGRTAYFRVEADAHYANEFVVLVGRSSKGRKGTSWSWVQKILSFVDPTWAAERIASGSGSGEGLMFEVRDPVTAFDKDKGTEVTIDAGVDDKRLLVMEGEYAVVLKVIRREGNTLSVVIRNAWDRGDLRSMTKNARLKATGAHISIIGHITATELRRNLNETESANGFANRKIFFLVARSKCLPDGGSLPDNALDSFIERIREAVAFARGVGLVRRDAAATARWHAIYPTLSEGEDSLVGSITGRAEAHVMRIALIYALLDKSPVITLEHLDAALALWEHSVASCRAIFGDQLGDPIADTILAALRAAPAGLQRAEITKVVLGGHKKSAEISAALSVLTNRGLAICGRVDSAGRPAELWRAVLPPSSFAAPTSNQEA